MPTITAQIRIKCSEKNHLELSSFLRTILHTLDMAVEEKSQTSDFEFYIAGAHPDSKTNIDIKSHPLKKPFGL